ncbi:unnamed protein product [Phytomonas sp. Hart1]|nr:unnamed protein product [Phytomonas sp. Hart1]|eukprot:CCW68893.1 unnamed protein product [Phytomonas sp. isolate Hart1]
MIQEHESEIKHLGCCSSQKDEVCQLPIPQEKFDALQNYCTQLESELDEARQKASLFQQEAITLHSLVKLAQDSESVDVTQVEGRCLMLEKELKSLYRQLNDAWTLCEAYQHRCGKACEVAERAQKELHQAQEEKHFLEKYITEQLGHLGASLKENKSFWGGKCEDKLDIFSNGNDSDISTTSGEIPPFAVCKEIELDISLTSDTGLPRNTCDKTTIPILGADSSSVVFHKEQTNQLQQIPNRDDKDRSTPKEKIDVPPKEQMLNKVNSPTSEKCDVFLRNIDNSLDEDSHKLKRALSILKGGNHMLICRVTELVERNKTYIRNIASLEKQVSNLNHKLRTSGSVENWVSSPLP